MKIALLIIFVIFSLSGSGIAFSEANYGDRSVVGASIREPLGNWTSRDNCSDVFNNIYERINKSFTKAALMIKIEGTDTGLVEVSSTDCEKKSDLFNGSADSIAGGSNEFFDLQNNKKDSAEYTTSMFGENVLERSPVSELLICLAILSVMSLLHFGG